MKGWKSCAVTAALATIAVIGAACGSDSPTAPQSQTKTLDVNALLGQIAAGDLTQNSGAQAALSLPTAFGLSLPSATSCAFDASSQGFVCAPATVGGFQVALSYWLYDAAGHALQVADASKTASIRTVTDLSGSLAPPSGPGVTGSSSLTSHSDMTLSGLLSDTHTLNGTSNSHYDVSFSGTTQLRSVMDDTSHTANVMVPATATNGAYWPTAGTITSDMHVVTTSASLPAITSRTHSVLTFLGAGKVKLDLTVSGVTSTCTFDFSSRTPPVCS